MDVPGHHVPGPKPVETWPTGGNTSQETTPTSRRGIIRGKKGTDSKSTVEDPGLVPT
jgi:hypothetical protein